MFICMEGYGKMLKKKREESPSHPGKCYLLIELWFVITGGIIIITHLNLKTSSSSFNTKE